MRCDLYSSAQNQKVSLLQYQIHRMYLKDPKKKKKKFDKMYFYFIALVSSFFFGGKKNENEC